MGAACVLQANEAKAAAVEEVERLLQHSEDLKRLHTLCQDYEQKAQVIGWRDTSLSIALPCGCVTARCTA